MAHALRKRYKRGKQVASLLLLMLLLAGSSSLAYAQDSTAISSDVEFSKAERFTMVLRGVPLKKALEKLVATTQINLLYDTGLVQDERVFCTEEEVPAEALLRCVLRDAALDFYQTSSGTYVLTESPRRASRRGRLAGVVVDRATGEPLPNANVYLADANVGSAANEAGLFNFSLVAGLHRLVVTYVGYETQVDSIRVASGERTRRRIALRARPVANAPVVVEGLQQRLPSGGLGKGVLTAEQLTAPQGVGTVDLARGASSILGVNMQAPLADLHIQGGASGEHQMQLDGVPVRSPVTLGRLLGAFSPLAIRRLTVHKAGFGVESGSFLSGLVAAEHVLSDPTNQYAAVQVDPLSLNARANGSLNLPGSLQGTAMAAARTSLWNVYRDPTLDGLLQEWHAADPLLLARQREGQEDVDVAPRAPRQRTSDVNFSDVHLAARLRLHPFHTLYASVYRGHNVLDSRMLAVEEPAGEGAEAGDTKAVAAASGPRLRDRYHWTSWAGQVRHDWMLGARATGMFRLYASRQSLGHGYGTVGSGTDDESDSQSPVTNGGAYDGNRINEMAFEAGLDYNLTIRHHLKGGLKASRLASSSVIDAASFGPLRYRNASWQVAGYLKDEMSLGVHTTLEAGTRLTYLTDRQTVYAEPRLALRYDGSHRLLGDYALRLAGGLYRQFTNRFDLSSTAPAAAVPSLRFWLPTDRSLVPPKAYHLTSEMLVQPDSSWTINLEGYYKEQPHLLAIDYPALLNADVNASRPASQAAFVDPTRGRAFGGGLRVRYTGGRLRGTLRYDYSRSLRRYPSRFAGRLEPTPWNQPHRLSLEGSLSLTSALAARLGWRGVWGRRWAFRRAYYDYLAPQSTPDRYAPFDLRDPSEQALTPFYRLDAGLSYSRTWGGLSVQVRTELINVLDRENAFDWSLRPTDDGYQKNARALPGRRLLLSVSVGY